MDKHLKAGTKIQITTPGYVLTGTVITAHNYGTDAVPDWYIEAQTDCGYVYWKQSLDGGQLTKL